ncbi:patatin-like phospholipase family protein [Sphaerisporangium melleum]|uniref:patatin-like phospholipase family protein n=1 Tax=Sphaerisporangium melleum TaxID=321316 RepID=UPI00195217A7|nr:patatin-like phospholipase family protein [Sphaerisporangium melleum]
MNDKPAIGLALSGGGFRATAFGLGAMRTMHDCGLLSQVKVVSGISGGSLLAAMWAYGPANFDEFDDDVTTLVRRGLQGELAKRALAPRRMIKGMASKIQAFPGLPGQRLRTHARTEALVAALKARPFGSRDITDVTHPNLATVITATDLITTNAVRFGSHASACSAIGPIRGPIPVADAVAASAAFPILLPSLVRTYEFQDNQGRTTPHTVAMTDGGVYDNLGLSALQPGRSRAHTEHVYDLDYVFAIDAGRGRKTKHGAPYLLPRLARSFDITYNKTQDAARAQLNLAAQHGTIRGFLHAYLAMQDRNLPVPVADYVSREKVITYPTNFRAIPAEDFHNLTIRGEQLTRVLLAHYCPELRVLT